MNSHSKRIKKKTLEGAEAKANANNKGRAGAEGADTKKLEANFWPTHAQTKKANCRAGAEGAEANAEGAEARVQLVLLRCKLHPLKIQS